MAYNIELANRIRDFLATQPNLELEEKKMFRGLTFRVNGKMCINVSNDNLMCRFDPSLQEEVEKRQGFQSMVMRGQNCKGYCYVNEKGFATKKNFEYWVDLCVDLTTKRSLRKKDSSQKSAALDN